MTLIKVLNTIEVSEELAIFESLRDTFVQRTYQGVLSCVSDFEMRRDLCERNEETREKMYRKMNRTVTPKETLLRSSVR